MYLRVPYRISHVAMLSPHLEQFAAKTSLAVSSIEFCQYSFDERDIREGLGAGNHI
jgi:hypothetical protein